MVWSKIGKQALEYDSPTVLYSLPPPILVIFFPSYSQDTYLALCSLRLCIQYGNCENCSSSINNLLNTLVVTRLGVDRVKTSSSVKINFVCG